MNPSTIFMLASLCILVEVNSVKERK